MDGPRLQSGRPLLPWSLYCYRLLCCFGYSRPLHLFDLGVLVGPLPSNTDPTPCSEDYLNFSPSGHFSFLDTLSITKWNQSVPEPGTQYFDMHLFSSTQEDYSSMAGSFPEGDFSLDESLSNASTVDYSTFTRHRGNRYPASRKSLQSQNQKAHGFSLPSAMPHGRESAFHYAPRSSGQDGSLSLQSGRDHFTFSYTSGKSDITDLSRDASELTEYSDTQIHGPRMMDQYVTSPRQGYDGAWSNDDYGVGLSSASNLQEEFSKTFVTERKNTTAPVVFESQQYLSCDTDNYTGALLPSSNAGFLNIYTRGDGQTTQPDMVRGVRMRSTALSGMPTALAMDSIESLDSFNIQATSTQELRPSRRSLMGNRRISMDPVSLEVPTPEFAGTNWGFPDLLNVGAEGYESDPDHFSSTLTDWVRLKI
ncbi:hypothetical protein BJ546DRAFT_105067 [Cryomyces antarcticus]